MKVKYLTINDSTYPLLLKKLPTPPKELYVLGADLTEIMERPRVTIVGSRGVSTYGQQVTAQLAGELAERGFVVVSGLALGVDGTAHQGALAAGSITIAVLPCGLVQPYANRSSHFRTRRSAYQRISGRHARAQAGFYR